MPGVLFLIRDLSRSIAGPPAELWNTLIQIFNTFPMVAVGEWTVGLGGSWEAGEEVWWSLGWEVMVFWIWVVAMGCRDVDGSHMSAWRRGQWVPTGL